MARGGLPALAGLDIGDPPQLWETLGFTVAADGRCRVGSTCLHLGREQPGITGWSLRAEGPLPASIDGIPTRAADAGAPQLPPPHPNGATGVDHVVVRTPDLERTLAALTGCGLVVRRIREAGPELRQAFLWAGDVLLEVAGPPEPTGDGPAALWGIVLVVPDLEAVAALSGSPLGSVRPAVQEGRMIATVRRELGSSVPLAFMTPPPPRRSEDPPQ